MLTVRDRNQDGRLCINLTIPSRLEDDFLLNGASFVPWKTVSGVFVVNYGISNLDRSYPCLLQSLIPRHAFIPPRWFLQPVAASPNMICEVYRIQSEHRALVFRLLVAFETETPCQPIF